MKRLFSDFPENPSDRISIGKITINPKADPDRRVLSMIVEKMLGRIEKRLEMYDMHFEGQTLADIESFEVYIIRRLCKAENKLIELTGQIREQERQKTKN